MTGWDDLPYEMRVARIDDDTIDRMFAGRIDPDDAPPGYSEVARILHTVGSPPRGRHPREVEHVAAARRAMSIQPPVWRGPGGSPARHRRVLAGLIVTGALIGIPGLAAANVLPGPAQRAVSHMLNKVGISVPARDARPASGDHPASTGSAISSIATSTSSTGVAKGAEISSVASGGKSQAGQHGHGHHGAGSGHVPASNRGGTGTADAASHGKSQVGTARANEKSGGHSSAGSGNAHTGERPASHKSVHGS